MAVLIVDVREPDEFSAGHIDGALNVPLDSIMTSDLAGVSKDDQIILYCNSGNRSGLAQQILVARGYKNVQNGINAEHIKAAEK
jgi:phage shock protein E